MKLVTKWAAVYLIFYALLMFPLFLGVAVFGPQEMDAMGFLVLTVVASLAYDRTIEAMSTSEA